MGFEFCEGWDRNENGASRLSECGKCIAEGSRGVIGGEASRDPPAVRSAGAPMLRPWIPRSASSRRRGSFLKELLRDSSFVKVPPVSMDFSLISVDFSPVGVWAGRELNFHFRPDFAKSAYFLGGIQDSSRHLYGRSRDAWV